MLLFGKYNTKDELAIMEVEEKNITLMAEMEMKSSHSFTELEGSVLHSHWSRNVETWISLVEECRGMA